jgi:hypothetical protein
MSTRLTITFFLLLTTLACLTKWQAYTLTRERDDYRRQATLAVREALDLRLELNRARALQEAGAAHADPQGRQSP